MQNIIILVTEGETDELFYKKVVSFLRKNNTKKSCIVEFISLKGIGNYSLKVPGVYKNRIKVKYPDAAHYLFLTYDTDVFEFAKKPPVNRDALEKTLLNLGVKRVFHIPAVHSIEDWFLADLQGIYKYLGISPVKKINGTTGYEKLKWLFRKTNRLYLKGFAASDFINSLNIPLIVKSRTNELKELIAILK